MDRNGFAQFASINNLAHRARVSPQNAEKAVECLIAPDKNSANPDNEGRRIEKVAGGYLVLNFESYRNVKDQVGQEELNRKYQQEYRERKRKEKLTDTSHDITPLHSSVSVYVNSSTKKEERIRARDGFSKFWSAYPKKVGKGAAEKSFNSINPSESLLSEILQAVEKQKRCKQWLKEDGQFIPNPSTWLNQKRWGDDPGLQKNSDYDPNNWRE
jgi:hypothetical protein